MKCPSCGKEVNENTSYCPSCGSSLYGPRSINLSDLGGSETIQSNNIESITGIDINDISPIQGPIEDSKTSKKVKEKKVKVPKNRSSKKIDFGTIIFLVIIAALLALCIYLFVENKKLKNSDKPLVTPPEETSCVEGYYGLTNSYTFLMPDNWIYTQTSNELVITNKIINLLVFKYAIGKVDHITADTLKNEYINQGYSIVTVAEDTLNSKKIMYVKYASNNINFVDFYYQYDSEKIIYGQISSSEFDILTTDVKNIISSITIQTRENNITVGKAPVLYENIIGLMN